ncbi:MAG: NUDIX hydrolase [Opitutaceae bacterium]
MSSSGPERWIRGEERPLATTRILDLRTVSYFHRGRSISQDFVVIGSPDWVNIVAVTPQGDLVLVRQFRHGIDDFSLELPGGVMEPGESPVEAALRELREETGYVGPQGRLLAWVHPNPAIQDNRCHFVLVEGAVRTGDMAWDRDEEIEVSTAPVAEVFGWARDGRITHSLVLCALFHYQAWHQGGRGAV